MEALYINNYILVNKMALKTKVSVSDSLGSEDWPSVVSDLFSL